MLKFTRIALLTIASIAAQGAFASNHTSNVLGNAAADSAADRTLTVTSSTKYVNVTNGETVKFSVNGQEFAWHFDTLADSPSFALAKIAPPGLNVDKVRVYVDANPDTPR